MPRLVKYAFILFSLVILSVILGAAYNSIGVSSWYAGCTDASRKFGNDFGPQYKIYMDKACANKLQQVKKQFGMED